MHNRLIGFASCLIVLVLGGSAFARDTEDSPEYKAWKEWKAGATARMRTEVTEGGTKTIATTTVTLKKKAADRLVLEMAISTEVAGMKIRSTGRADGGTRPGGRKCPLIQKPKRRPGGRP